MTDDPTTVAIEAQNAERDELHAENQRLRRELVAACTEVEVVKAERDRFFKLGDSLFVEGYNQAVCEIRDHFAKAKNTEVIAEIEKLWFQQERA